jgi:TonB family protein
VVNRDEKMASALDAAREKLQKADSEARELSQRLRGYDDQQTRINALSRLSDVLSELQSLGGNDPFTGENLKKGGYDDTLQRIQTEKQDHDSIVLKLKDELKAARSKAAELNLEYEKLAKKLQEEEKKRRRAALEAYRKEVREKGFQAREDDVYYRPMAVQWRGDPHDNRRLRRISMLVLLFTLLLSVGVMNIIVPEPEVEETKLPPRLAKLVIEQQKPEPQQKQQRSEELKPTETAAAPKTAAQARARAKAKKSGLLAMSDTFESLKDNTFEAKLANQENVTVSGRHSAATQNTIVASQVASSSGGIKTSSLSNETGSGGLKGRSTSRVSSDLADAVAAAADRRVGGSGKASRTDEEIQIVFDRNKAALYRLYNQQLRINPTLQGKIVLKLTISPSGQVTMCKVVSSTLKSPALERKIELRVRLFNFGAKKVDAVTISYPIDFFPA